MVESYLKVQKLLDHVLVPEEAVIHLKEQNDKPARDYKRHVAFKQFNQASWHAL